MSYFLIFSKAVGRELREKNGIIPTLSLIQVQNLQKEKVICNIYFLIISFTNNKRFDLSCTHVSTATYFFIPNLTLTIARRVGTIVFSSHFTDDDLRKAKRLAQGHTASKRGSLVWKPKFKFLTTKPNTCLLWRKSLAFYSFQ